MIEKLTNSRIKENGKNSKLKKVFSGFLILVLVFSGTSSAFANFTIKADPDEHGTLSIKYFSFEDPQHDAWRNSGGYLHVVFNDNTANYNEYEPVHFEIPGTTNRMYFHYAGFYYIQAYYADGRKYGSWDDHDLRSLNCKYDEDYYSGFRHDQHQHYKGNPFTSPNLDCQTQYNPTFPDPEDPEDPDPGDPGDGGDGGDGGDPGEEPEDPFKMIMDKLNEISNRIPPPPDYQKAADTFRDTVVPAVMNDLKDYLGTTPPPEMGSGGRQVNLNDIPAPSKPHVPNPSQTLENNKPSMPNNTELENSGYDLGDIKSQAPEIEFRADDSGGFDLSIDPIGSLPSTGFEGNFPMPGEAAGDYNSLQPEPNGVVPTPSPDGAGVTEYAPPIPDGSGGGGFAPPIPGTGGSSGAPIPGGSTGGGNNTPPTPGYSEVGLIEYKNNPSAPDGSGGEMK